MDQNSNNSNNRTSADEGSNKSPSGSKNNAGCAKPINFKKSMIVEYEKIEHPSVLTTTEDSQSSEFSSTSGTSNSNSSSSSTSGTNSSSESLNSANRVISFTDPAVTEKLQKNSEPDQITIGTLLATNQSSSKQSWDKNKTEVSKNSNKKQNTSTSNYRDNESKLSKSGKHSKGASSDIEHSKTKAKKTYCICHSSDSQRFMIACDKCDEWYHGDCVGVSQSLSKKIKAFFCHICRQKKPSLSIRYKSKFEEFIRNKSKLQRSEIDGIYLRFHKENRAREKKEIELTASKSLNSSKTKEQKSSKSSSSSLSIQNPEKKCYGKSNIPGEDIIDFVSAISKLGHEVGQLNTQSSLDNSADSARKRKHSASRSKTSSENEDSDFSVKLNVKSKSYQPYSSSSSSMSSSDSGDSSFDSDLEKRPTYHQNDHADITADESLNNSNSDDDSNFSDSTGEFRKKSKNQSKKSSSRKSNPSSKSRNPSSKLGDHSSKTKKSSSSNNKNARNPANKKTSANKNPQRCRKRNSSSKTYETDLPNENEEEESEQTIEPQQCLGPECRLEALEKSKYCSEECGLNLAKNRLIHFLKKRIEQYDESPSYSKILNETELERINSEIASLRIKLKGLEQQHLDLDSLIDKAKHKNINTNAEKERDQNCGDSNESEIYCVTCGSLHTEKIALKHMEKCFNKVESQAFFGSYFKTHINGKSMFCDYYNVQTKMYCKRLKVMCPEHEKEKKINDDEVCGCPLPKSSNLLIDSKEICLASKRLCSIHFKWEKLRRAHIDLEKLRIWLKLEELLEQKRINETSLNQRASLLSILLHQTKVNTSQAESGIATNSTTNINQSDKANSETITNINSMNNKNKSILSSAEAEDQRALS